MPHPLPGPSPGRAGREGAPASWAGPWPAGAQPARGPALGGALRWLRGESPCRTQVIRSLPEPESQDPEMANEPEGTGLGARLHQSLNRGEKPPSRTPVLSPSLELVLKSAPVGSPSHRDTVTTRQGLGEREHTVCTPGGRSWEPLGPSPLYALRSILGSGQNPWGPQATYQPCCKSSSSFPPPGEEPQTPQNVTPQPHSHHPFPPPSRHVDLPRAVHPRSGPAPGPGHVQAALTGGFLPRSHRVCVPCTS